MNNDKDKELDDLFKKKLEDPVDQSGYREEDWDSLEQMLDKHKKRRGIVFLLPILGSVAALLLLFFGWWLFRPQAADQNAPKKLQAVAANHQPAKTDVNNNAVNQQQKITGEANTVTPATGNYAKNIKTGGNNKAASVLTGDNSSKAIASGQNTDTNQPGGSTQITAAYSDSNEALFAANAVPVFENRSINNQQVKAVNLPLKKAADAAGSPAKKIMQHTPYRTQYALSVFAAPDINGVGSFQQSKLGNNVGFQFSVGLTKRLIISTGATYSVKPYVSGFEDYHTAYQFQVDPTSVSADCRMLDIPINIGYQIYNKHQNKISLGTGLSSYIMLHESYQFNYADPYTNEPLKFTVPNSSSYFFGVLNLNATYDRQLNEKVGLSLTPYLKLPLTNIGYSQVRLQTTGIAVGLRWNLNSMSKP
jgi:cytoskeletal protein RodZ